MCDLPALFVAHERAFRDMSQYIMRYIAFLCKPTTPQSATLPAPPRHAYVCRRHYSGALTQGSLYGVSNTANTRKGGNTYEFWKCGMGIS